MFRLARSAVAAPLIGLAVAGMMALAPVGAASASTVVALWHMNNKCRSCTTRPATATAGRCTT